jgi:hypothetical protein
MQMKFENYEICHYLITSHMQSVVKIWMSFEHFVMYKVMTFELKFEFKTFCVVNRQHILFQAIFE